MKYLQGLVKELKESLAAKSAPHIVEAKSTEVLLASTSLMDQYAEDKDVMTQLDMIRRTANRLRRSASESLDYATASKDVGLMESYLQSILK